MTPRVRELPDPSGARRGAIDADALRLARAGRDLAAPVPAGHAPSMSRRRPGEARHAAG